MSAVAPLTYDDLTFTQRPAEHGEAARMLRLQSRPQAAVSTPTASPIGTIVKQPRMTD